MAGASIGPDSLIMRPSTVGVEQKVSAIGSRSGKRMRDAGDWMVHSAFPSPVKSTTWMVSVPP